MSNTDSKEIPKWPDSLPPPSEMTMLPPEHVVYRESLIKEEDLYNLVHDLFYFPEDKYFLYFEYESPAIPEGFDTEKLEHFGLALRKYENFFYRRPFGEDEPDRYSYMRLTAADIKHPWHQKLVDSGPMYCRVQIELMEWAKKDIELQRLKSLSSKNEDPLLLQPNFMGVGVDLKKVPSWLKRVFSKKV